VKTLVTGGTGFVGSHLVELLLSEGHEVTCLVRSAAKAEALFAARRPHIVQAQLNDTSTVRAAASDVEVVFHVAGVTSARSRREFFAINEGGTRAVLEAMPAGLHRFVLVSSLAAGGPATRGHPLQGTERPSPITIYGSSKLAAELAVRGAPFPWSILRPPPVYGPRDVEFLRVFRLVRAPVFPVFGTGRQELTFIYAEDLARALLATAQSDAAAGHVYYPTHPEIVEQRTFIQAVARAVRTDHLVPRFLPIPSPVARAALWATSTAALVARRATVLTADKANEFFADSFACSPAPLERDTGWRATHGLDTGLPLTAAWYREHRWL
jgi:nucleoside-diphosphate-sugar epimerase